MKKSMFGFTLIELLIVVVVVAILSAIALPSYNAHIVKANRRAAQAFMMEVANKERQYLLDARTYTTSLATVGSVAPADVSSKYAVTVTTTDAPPAFVVIATPIAGGTQAGDGTLTLTSDGTKSPTAKW